MLGNLQKNWRRERESPQDATSATREILFFKMFCCSASDVFVLQISDAQWLIYFPWVLDEKRCTVWWWTCDSFYVLKCLTSRNVLMPVAGTVHVGGVYRDKIFKFETSFPRDSKENTITPKQTTILDSAVHRNIPSMLNIELISMGHACPAQSRAGMCTAAHSCR